MFGFFGSFESQQLIKGIIKKAAHPELKIVEELEWTRKMMSANFIDLSRHLDSLEHLINKLGRKVDIVLDIKGLKRKINDLVEE